MIKIKKYRNYKDITGQRFGRLVALRPSRVREIGINKRKKLYWICHCSCKNIKEVGGEALRSGNSKSCGCLIKDITIKRSTTHGLASRGNVVPEYNIWSHMRRRCLSKNNNSYKNYGARGISVCDSWRRFENFYADMGKRPSKQHSIERINNDGNYEPSNCKWILSTEQSKNQRSNVKIKFNGETKILSEWARLFGIKYSTLYRKIVTQKRNMDTLGLKKSSSG